MSEVDPMDSSPEKSDGNGNDGGEDRQGQEQEAEVSSSYDKQLQSNDDDSAAVAGLLVGGGGDDNNSDHPEEEELDGDESSDDDASGGSEDDDDDDGDDSSSESDSEEEDDGLSEYERLRIERIARNNARLAELGFAEPPKEEKKKRKTPAKPRRSLPDGPRRQLPGRAKRATFNESALWASAKKERREEEEKNFDACYNCQKEEGELRSCDFCRRLYHVDCHDPPISPNDEEFKCTICDAAGKTRRVACGKCDGCMREMDCMTCVACVGKYSVGVCTSKKSSKCIFRRCQSWGKAKLIRANTDDDGGEEKEEEKEEEEDRHDADCFVCQNGGDVICCDGCTKVYHSNCHKPKIWDLPEGEWYCMHCAQSKKVPKVKEKKQKYSGPLVADLGHRDITCTVKFPKIECIVCEEKEVTGAFKHPDWTTCRACDDSYHLNCLDSPLDVRPNKWRCPTCKERKIKVKEAKEKKEEKPLFEGEHEDDCFMCYNGGDLLCCDYCSKAYHPKCHIPPLDEIPTGLWKCQECCAVEYVRKMKCGECKACLADECGKCANCLDKPKFGGKNRLKQACEKKNCPFKRFAPPSKATPQKKTKKNKKTMQFTEGASSSSKTKKRKRDSTEEKVGVKDGTAAVGKKDVIPKQKRFRPVKRQKVDSDEADQPMKERKSAPETIIVKGQNDPTEDTNKIINSKPLKNDPVGNKIRLIIVKALKHPDNSKFQDKAFELLRTMATNADNASKIILLGGLKIVSKAMKEHSDKTIVQAEASALLAELAWVNPPCVVAITEEGCLQLVLSSMQCHGSHFKVQQMGCGFFRAMSYDFANHQSIERVGGVGVIIDAMKRNSKKYDILKEGCYFLQNILCSPAITPEMIQVFISKGVVPIIVDAMLCATSEDTEYLEAACGVLANLSINESAREHIGGYSSSMTALLTVLGPGISVDACKCSLNALKLLATGNDENTTKIVHLGGIKTVIDLLAPHDDVGLLDSGLRLLAEVTINSEANTLLQLLVDAGGFKLVASAMSKHRNLSYIQATCCRILRNLPLNADKVNASSVCILSAMNNHREDKMVQFEGCHALLQFCCRFPTLAESMQSTGVFPIATDVRSMKRKRGSTSKGQQADESSQKAVQTSATKESGVSHDNRIRNRSDDSNMIDSIIKSKPLKDDPLGNKMRLIIVKALKHPDNSKFQDKACEVLRAMTTKNADNASKMITLGGLKMVSKAMKEHSDKTIVQAEACALLAELAWTNPSCAAAITDEGCLELALSSMEHHGNHLKVQQMGCGFFRAMSYDFANHQIIDSINGVGVIIDAMKRNSKKYDILKEGCYFLQNILCNPDILPETIQLVVSKDIVRTIIDTISEKADDAEYLGAACGLIANLAIDDNARKHIGGYSSSVPTLLTVLGSAIDMDACKCSLNALKLLATGSVGNKTKIVHLGGIKTVLDFLTSPNDVILVDSGLGLLSELIKDSKQNSQLLLDAGGYEFVKSEMMDHSDSPHLQARACAVLCNLPVGIDKADDAVSLILSAMKNHVDDSSVQYEGCHALLQYCCRFPATAKSMQSEEAGPILGQSQFVPRLPTAN